MSSLLHSTLTLTVTLPQCVSVGQNKAVNVVLEQTRKALTVQLRDFPRTGQWCGWQLGQLAQLGPYAGGSSSLSSVSSAEFLRALQNQDFLKQVRYLHG